MKAIAIFEIEKINGDIVDIAYEIKYITQQNGCRLLKLTYEVERLKNEITDVAEPLTSSQEVDLSQQQADIPF